VQHNRFSEKLLRSFRWDESGLRWDLLIILALTTGMRKSELLNTVWNDIDFAEKTIEVSPKKSADKTWEWHIKD
jgi:integrase